MQNYYHKQSNLFPCEKQIRLNIFSENMTPGSFTLKISPTTWDFEKKPIFLLFFLIKKLQNGWMKYTLGLNREN